MESIIAASITGLLTLAGVLASNSRSRAVMECKLDELSNRVEKHNRVIERVYALEERASLAEHDIDELKERIEK